MDAVSCTQDCLSKCELLICVLAVLFTVLSTFKKKEKKKNAVDNRIFYIRIFSDSICKA